MPWYEPCARNGYTKFYAAPQLRDDRWVVSDNYLQSLLTAYRQAYVNAGGPDYEDSDDRLLDMLAENCASSTSAAANLGAQDADRDRAAGQLAHTQSLAPGGAIPATPPTGQAEHMATVYATSTNPQGQPGENPVMGAPVSFGAPGMAAGDVASSSFLGGAGGSAPAPAAGLPWWLWLVAAAGVYFVVSKR